MILSVICEELGVFGAIVVLILFGLLLYRLMFIARKHRSVRLTDRDRNFAHIALQVILNIMVVTNMIPTTGVTLPFVSYGGTSVLFLMTEMDLPECIPKVRPNRKAKDVKMSFIRQKVWYISNVVLKTTYNRW